MVRLNLQLFAKSNEELAKEVLQGKWGNGQDRKNRLTAAGYDYQAVQDIVNGGGKTTSTTPVSTTQTASNNAATSATTTKINGVNQSTYDKATADFKTSDNTNKLQTTANDYADKYYELANKENIIDQKYWDAMNKEFVMPEAVTQADAFLSGQLEKIQSGKTSYTDQINDLMNKYMNREEFEYDVDNDVLFQQALASAMNSGKSAMQDTIGQASALTGGYGSTYATSAGNQAYNSFIEDAYNNLPQYYQMALEAYQMEGQEMLNQLGVLNDADAREYDRLVNSFDATSQYRNQLYNEAYTKHQDEITNAYNGANLQLNEYGVQLDAAYNSAALSNDRWQQSYQNDFNEWSAEIDKWTNVMGLENSDYWSQTNFDESVRQYEKDYEQTERWNQANLDYNYAQLAEEQRQFNYSIGDTNGDGVVSDEEKVATTKEGYVVRQDENGNDVTYKSPTESQLKKALEAYDDGGEAGLDKYVDSLPSNIDVVAIDDYINTYGKWKNWNISEDTKNWNNWLVKGNEDYNDKYSNGSTTKSYKELKKEINDSNLPQSEKDALLKKLQKQSKK